jgi:amino acid adenylation domain-containing protein
LALPTDRPRPTQQSYRGGALPLTLPVALVEQLRECCQSAGATLYMGLLASWATLMSRLSGQAEVVIGSTVANRRRKEIEPLVGFFVNTLAVNLPVKPADTAWSLLAEAKERLLGAYAHQDVPLEQVVEAVNPGRSMAYSPLFQTTLNMNNAPVADLQLPGLSLHNISAAIEHVTAHFDLSLSLTEEGPLLRGRLEYASDLFDEATVTRWMSYWERLLWGMVRDPDAPLQRLPLLDAQEQQRMLDRFNDTAVAPCDELIHALFEAQVARTPDALALAYEETSLSYAELNRRANRVAHALIAAGVVPDTRVALCMERGPGQLVGLLGILKAGGAYVPLDPAYPRERLAYLMDDSAPVMALLQSGLESVVDTERRLVLDSEGRWADELAFAEHNPLFDALRPDHLAYVIYTSGSTGKPKGVMVEHRSVVNLWAALKREIFGLFDAAARVAMSASLAFDASVKMWLQLLSGHCIVPVPAAVRADARALLRFLSASRIDVFDGTPTQLELLVAEGLLHARGHRPAAALIGGEPISSKLWNQLRQCEGMRFHNVYGPTECTVDATTCLIGSAHAEPNIGRPIANVQIYVLDAYGEPLPIGVAGELVIGGAGVARGYLDRPELTAERFVDDRFGPSGGRLYRTGDLGRWRADGVVEYLGRNDHQVKVRGFRIELGEIEAALLACEGIREAVVVAREDVPGDKRLVAYVVGDRDGTDALRLREQLSQHLADYMLPAACVALDAMPLSANGKLDRHALPAPDGSSLATQTYEAPQGEIETALAGLWQELLGVERVGRRDQFFELGGHSLLAVQLVGRVRQVMRREVTLRRLFEEPSLSGFAGIVAQAEPRDGLPPLRPCDRQQPLPLSWSQQRLWFLDQLDHAAGAAYHMPAALRLQGPLDEQALRQALDRVVARHEILRTRFVRPQQGGEPVQLIDACGTFQWQRTYLGDLSAATRDAAVARHASEEALAPFDLSQGPLIRVRLLVLSAAEHVLLLTRHHIVSDGWSTGVLVREVGALYEAFVRGQADPLPPLAIQYADYAAWQRGWLRGDLLRTQLDYWKSQLAHAPALLELPTDQPRPARQSYRGGAYDFVLPQALVERLRERCKTAGATLHMGLLASWSLLLSRLSGQAKIVVGVPVASRRRKEIEPLIGFFVNTLAVNLPIEGGDTSWSLIAEARHRLLGAYAHQDVPFEQVVEAINPERSMAHSPLFQATLNLNNAPRSELNLAGLSLQNITGAMGHATTHFDLSMSLTEDAGVLRGQLEYASDLFEASTIARWAGYWEHLLRGMVDTPDRPVGRLPLCDARELPAPMPAVSVDMDKGAEPLIHALFEAQAARTPEAIALVYEQQTLSYAELNRRANQLAHALVASGVAPDMRVGLCMERGLGLVVGVLGILKAGGAYVPLDPVYPRERLQYLIEDSAPALVLVQSGLEDVLEAARVLIIGSDGLCPHEQDMATDNPVIEDLRADHLAYVIYTSGSTGQPKGAMVEHRQVARLFDASSRWFEFGPQEVWTLFHSYAFDFSVWEIWGALLHGSRLVVVPFEVSRSPELFHALLRRERVSFLNQTPSAFQGLLRVDASATERLHLRQVALGGEPLDAASLLPWLERYGEQARLLNMYGPTETTVAATFHPVTVDDLRGPGGSIIGQALPDLAVRVVDAYGHEAPIGVPGELWIAGAGVSRGYLDRPELTAERFVTDEAPSRHRWYRSGDLVRRRADGNLQYLGRIDTQVKVRGFRIELGEIEAALLACDGIREAAVLAREDTPGDKRLVAYVTGTGGQLHAAALRERLARRLPDYMLPSAYMILEAMPLNANGKLDRRALPPPAALSAAIRDYEAPQGETEAALARLWEELLGVERIGRGDHFFELGGHSLLAVEMVGRAQKSLQRHIDLKELFVAPVLQDFAAAISMLEGRPSEHSSLVPIRPHGASQPLFLVHGGAGGAHYAQSLARWIDSDVPIYGLEPKGYLTAEAPLETVQDMAHRYVDAIREVQPHGPYRIAGWSGGGTIAYEMASLLLGMDEQVPFVGLIDTLFEQAPKPDVRGVIRHYASAPFDAAEEFILMLSRFEDGAQNDSIELPPAGTSFASTIEFFARRGRIPESLRPLLHDTSAVEQYLRVCHANRKAIWNYVPHAFSGPVTLFSAARENRADPSIGWSKMLGKHLEVVLVDGWHFNMVEDPFAEGLCHAISAAMRASTTQPAQHVERDYTPCITIQAGRRDTPAVFCVPGAGASVTSFAELAITLDVDNPLHGLQPRGLCGQMSPHRDVPSAASAYVRAIRKVAPHGPYRLLGHSFGGWVALETALQLEDAGETVLSITVLDTHAPSLAPRQAGYLGELDVLLRLIEIFEMHPGVDLQLPASVLEPLAFDDRLQLLLRRLIEARRMPARAQLQTLRGIYRVFNRNLHTGYQPRRMYRGSFHAAVAPGADVSEHAQQWRRYVEDPQVWQAEGNHVSLLGKPHVDTLARWLQPILVGEEAPA